MLQVPAAATVATAQATGPRTAESPCLPPRTGAASIIQAVPQLLDPGQEVLPTEAQSDRGDDVLFSQLPEVKEACEFEESSGTILSQVKGRLRRHVQFWRSIGALDMFYLLYARVTVCLFCKFLLCLLLGIINQHWIIQSLLMMLFWSF